MSAAIQTDYIDALGRRHRPPATAVRALREACAAKSGDRAGADAAPVVVTEGDPLPSAGGTIHLEDGGQMPGGGETSRIPAGYHWLEHDDGRVVRLIVAPAACYLPRGYRSWGWAIQLYAARSRDSWGIGDLADLRSLGRWAKKDGAGIALVNPLAAAAPTLPQQPSPYFPTSRRFRNPLYLRVEEMDGAAEARGLERLASRARALNRERLIDRDRVYGLKLDAFERIWKQVRRQHDRGFDRFVAEIGPPLVEYASFCALAEKHGADYRAWPVRFRRPLSTAVEKLSEDAALGERVAFHAWLQYQIDRQLQRASAAMPLMQDLPIGFDADGADAWAFQDVLADGVTVGAPPDEFNTNGQNWGLPPFVPDALRAAGYEPFIQTIRACLRHAGGLRIDHVMGLFRLFWIPAGMSARDGSYVMNPADDFLAIVALESQRARAVIVGEDLGTVDEGFRQQLTARAVLSYRLLWFEKEHPRRFPRQALAAITTHDLPTVAGMWTGTDLDAQKRLHLSPNEAGTEEIRGRLRKLAKRADNAPRLPASGGRPAVADVIARSYQALGSAPSRILTATLDDAMAVEERPNMPASDGWPNWSLALPRPIESLRRSPLARRIAAALRR